MPSQKNQTIVAEIKSDLERAKSIVLANYSGLDVASQSELRAKVAEAGGSVRVLRNRLFKVAIKEKLGEVSESLEGALNDQTAFLFSFDDAVAAIKALYQFADSHEKLEVKVGILDGKVLDRAQVDALSKLPSKKELIGQLIARINGPVYGLVNVIQGPARGLVYALKAIGDQKAAN